MSAPRSRKLVDIAWATVLVLGVATALFGFLLRRDRLAFAAPFLGPWAGTLFGHRDCTMATVAPIASRVIAVLLAAGTVAICLIRKSVWSIARVVAALVFLTAAAAWCGAAVLSFVNMAS